MPDVQVTAVGGRVVTNDPDPDKSRDNGKRSIVDDEREPEDKDDAAPGSLEWKELG